MSDIAMVKVRVRHTVSLFNLTTTECVCARVCDTKKEREKGRCFKIFHILQIHDEEKTTARLNTDWEYDTTVIDNGELQRNTSPILNTEHALNDLQSQFCPCKNISHKCKSKTAEKRLNSLIKSLPQQIKCLMKGLNAMQIKCFQMKASRQSKWAQMDQNVCCNLITCIELY